MEDTASHHLPRVNRHVPDEEDRPENGIAGLLVGLPVGLGLWALIFLVLGVF